MINRIKELRFSDFDQVITEVFSWTLGPTLDTLFFRRSTRTTVKKGDIIRWHTTVVTTEYPSLLTAAARPFVTSIKAVRGTVTSVAETEMHLC